jgi:hypothetical protein
MIMSLNIIGKGEGGTITFSEDADMIGVFMDASDWDRAIYALNYLAARPAIFDESDFYGFIADTIQDVLSSL